jgi:hypothetical protein
MCRTLTLAALASAALAAGLPGPARADGGVAAAPTPADVLANVAAVGDWRPAGEPTPYDPDNLWEYIDGAAALFTSYGFTEMATVSLEREGVRGAAAVDVYLLPDVLHAYGVYSRERGKDVTTEALGTEGYVEGSAARLFAGRYYVKVRIAPPPADGDEAAREIAKAVVSHLPPGEGMPSELSALPSKGLVPHTAQYIGNDLLGHACLADGIVADYDLGGDDPARLFFHIAADADTATAAMATMRDFFAKRGEMGDAVGGLGDEAFTGTEPYYGASLLARQGRAIAGVLNMPSDGVGRSLVREVLTKVRALHLAVGG